MDIKIEIFDEGKMLRLFIDKDLLNILMDSTLSYLNAVRQCYKINKNKEDKKTIEIVEEVLLDLMINKSFTHKSQFMIELDLQSFIQLKNILVCSVDVMDNGKKFNEEIYKYIDFGKSVEMEFNNFLKN